MLVPHVSSAAPKETQVFLLFFLWQEMSGVCSLQQFSPGECGKHECHGENETMGLAVCIELQLADTLCAQCIGCAFDCTCNQKEKQQDLSKISLWGRMLNSKT